MNLKESLEQTCVEIEVMKGFVIELELVIEEVGQGWI
jgi:hypothetical protein